MNTTVAAERIHRLCAGGGRVLVLIDGPAGAGKTTLARSLAWHLPGREVATIHMDDLYDGWDGLDDELTAYLAGDLIPQLVAGGPVRHRCYDWHRGSFGADVVVPDSDVLLIEGVGSGQRELAGIADLLIWVEAPDEVCTDRLLERDGEALAPYLSGWLQRQTDHFTSQRTGERADVVIGTV